MTKIGIIGTGGIGRKHIEALASLEDAEIAAVTDRDADAARKAAGAGTKAVGNISDCIRLADAVWICTPPASHRELAAAALGAGKHVYCEKPIAVRLDDADAMVEAAKKAGRVLATGFNMRYRRGFGRLRSLIEAGAVGTPVSYWCHRIGSLGVGGRDWRTDPAQLCGMTVESLSHDIDMVRWLFGEIEEVKAVVSGSRTDLSGYDDNACVLMRTAGGVAVTIHASWSSALGQGSRGVVGTEGTAVLEGPDVWSVSGIRWKSRGMDYEAAESFVDVLDTTSYRAADEAFLSFLKTGSGAVPTGGDGRAALAVSLAILESSATGRSVRPS